MFYAQLSGGVVVAVSQVAAAIESADMIPIESLDISLLGKTYAGGVFL